MKKKAFQDAPTTNVVNGYILRSFAWVQHDPDNLNTATLAAVYDLACVDANGNAVPSNAPGHQGIMARLQNVGTDQALTEWLQAHKRGADLPSFNAQDIQALVEADAAARFGLAFAPGKD